MSNVVPLEGEMLTLVSCSGDAFLVSHEAVKCARVVQEMLREFEHPQGLAMYNVTSEALSLIIPWLEEHKGQKLEEYVEMIPGDATGKPKVKFNDWDRIYFGNLEYHHHQKMIMAAYELGIRGLLEMARKAILYAQLPRDESDPFKRLTIPDKELSPEMEYMANVNLMFQTSSADAGLPQFAPEPDCPL